MAKYWQFVPRGRERWGAVNSTEAQARPDAPMTHRDTQRCGGSQGWEYCGVGNGDREIHCPPIVLPLAFTHPVISFRFHLQPAKYKAAGCTKL